MSEQWHRNWTGQAFAGTGMPPLMAGPAGHPCATCGAVSVYEWSPLHHRACSVSCLARQGPGQQTLDAVKQRHGITMEPLQKAKL